ncbi:hypothetical protein GCM10009738_09980 [Kitasatospora viridis]|uniref:Uncharacterized protein n=1 Tax=Kitasatospora viridis TaxID=281105 RepID=A0A561TSM7_9ACTN|nr:hypothetical protein FHX73_13152 [Kitasatospora viridis]
MSSSGSPGRRLRCGSPVLAAFDRAGQPYAGVAARVAARLVAQEGAADAAKGGDGQGKEEEGGEDR